MDKLRLLARLTIILREAESASAAMRRPPVPYRAHPAMHMVDRVENDLRRLLRELDMEAAKDRRSSSSDQKAT